MSEYESNWSNREYHGRYLPSRLCDLIHHKALLGKQPSCDCREDLQAQSYHTHAPASRHDRGSLMLAPCRISETFLTYISNR
jgi:hypothetical protein